MNPWGRILVSPLIALALLLFVFPQADGTARGRHVALGFYIPGVDGHPGRIDQLERQTGRTPAIVSTYRQWDQVPFEERTLRAVWRRGAVPMITWEPMSYQGRQFPLRKIAGGAFDNYLRRSARAANRWGHPILVRFAHEMNGDWYPWSIGQPGNGAGLYKRAWRHVVRVFRHQGARNVRWVWCPFVNQSGARPFSGQYPGDPWVDWVGLDGFDWGRGGSYYSFREIFGASYRTLTQLSQRPVVVAETGSGGSAKARWISQTLGRQLPGMQRIRAVVWFNSHSNGVDLRVDSPPRALRAFRRGAASPLYAVSRERFLGG
jgi:hypothetical protein